MIPHRRAAAEAFILAALAGLIFGLPLLSASAGFLLMLALAADWMARRFYDGVELSHRASRTGLAIDQEAEVWISVANPEPWPMPAVHFEDTLPQGLEVSAPVPRGFQQVFQGSVVWGAFHVGPHERVRHHLRITARHRGRWPLGPARVWSRDPLGWAQFERHAPEQPVLTVYPRLYAVPRGILAPNRPEGERRGPPWNPPDPLRMVGTRPYRPGDPLRLIHPHATAHTGTLQVKRLEPEGDEQLEILALAATAPNIWEGTDADLFESLVSATASVADMYLKTGAALGFGLRGTVYGWPKGVTLGPARGAEQWARIMTALAWVQPGGQGHDLTPALWGSVRRLRPGAHLVYLACFHRPEWAEPLGRLVHRGVQVTYVPVGPDGGAPAIRGIHVRPWTPGVSRP